MEGALCTEAPRSNRPHGWGNCTVLTEGSVFVAKLFDRGSDASGSEFCVVVSAWRFSLGSTFEVDS